MATSSERFPFSVPPSLGALKAATTAARFGQYLRRLLAPRLAPEVAVAASYAALAEELCRGHSRAGWAPPVVCRQVEEAGGRVVVRLVRGGASSFRSALVCRTDAPVQLDQLCGLRVAWVDPESAAGYLLPHEWLLQHGVDTALTFREEHFAGSYHDALLELVAGKVDVTATFAAAPGAARQYSGLDELPAEYRGQVQVFATTHETPNDGIVTAPAVDDETVAFLRERLLASALTASEQPVIRRLFDAEGFAPAARA